MALIDDRTAPADIATTNALQSIPDDLLGGPPQPAYLSFGTTPHAIENPPNADDDDTRVFMIRARCTGEHGPLKRKDGEVRYKRDMAIQAIWLPGEPEPERGKTQAELDAEAEAEAAKDQPPLFGDDGEPSTLGEIADELLGESLADAGTDDDSNVVDFAGRPPFSDGGE